MNWRTLEGQELASAVCTNVTGFNEFREQNPDWYPDFKSACFAQGADLRDANFSRATMGAVNLYNTDLRGAKFAGANLVNANLCSAEIEQFQVIEIMTAMGVTISD